MTYPEHWLLSFGGRQGSAGEIWSNNIRFMPEINGAPVPDYGQDEGILDDLEQDIRTHMSATNSGYSVYSKLDYIKFNKIGPDGKYANASQTVARYFPASNPAPATAASPYPHQIALVISFRTSAQRGYASKGRIYVPQPNTSAPMDTGKISATNCQNIANAWKTFLENLGNWPGLDLPESPMPHVLSSVGAGVGREIREVRVGDLFDTQRRRKNALDEVYYSATLTLPSTTP